MGDATLSGKLCPRLYAEYGVSHITLDTEITEKEKKENCLHLIEDGYKLGNIIELLKLINELNL